MKKFITILWLMSVQLGFVLPLNPTPGWYQQFLPNIGNRQITDITFSDSLTGFAAASQTSDTSYVLKTTNGGDNWQVVYRNFFAMTRLQFFNSNTGYAGGGYLYKTTDGGFNWSVVSTPFGVSAEDIYVLNQDTIWIVDREPTFGGVFRTTTGGANWTVQYQGLNPNKIYMYNRNFGFFSYYTGNALFRTTNSGLNWTQITGETGFRDMYFVDSLTGWKAIGTMKKTSNGGLNWIQQTLPSGGIIVSSGAGRLSVLNRDTIWTVGGYVQYPNLESRGIIYRTTNGGTNWLFQIPDTAIHSNTFYSFVQFLNSRVGWAYTSLTGIHTTDGGDPVWYTGIRQISSEVPSQFKLFQNYPNPFNNSSKFKFLITSNVRRQTSNVKVKVYDITGREVSIVLDKKLAPGEYEITFDGKDLPTGVYFYSLIVGGVLAGVKKMILLK